MQNHSSSFWMKLPLSLRAVGSGFLLAAVASNVLGAGVLLGLLARSSGSLIPGMIGHVVMDIGLFAI